MGGRWAIRRSDDQLMELIDSTGSWSVNDQRGTLLLCRVRTLREAVERVMLYQVLKQDVGAVCWETRENIIIFGRQSQRLATKIRRRARMSRSEPPVPVDGRSELITAIVQCVDWWCCSPDPRAREDILRVIDMLELELAMIETRCFGDTIEVSPNHAQPDSLLATLV
jgi:hypothetical protein